MEFVENNEFVVLFADVVQSRDLPAVQRAALQTTLLRTVESAAGRAVWPTPPAVTGGDAIQAMLPAGEVGPLVDLLVALADAVHPIRFAVGFGRGAIATPVDSSIALVDGPCFHHARGALDRAGERGVWGGAVGFGPAIDSAATALLVLMGTIREDWTDRQAEIVRAVRGHDTQKEAATALDVARSTISESLKAAHFEPLREGERALAELLGQAGADSA